MYRDELEWFIPSAMQMPADACREGEVYWRAF
jgi:hypothetical protein